MLNNLVKDFVDGMVVFVMAMLWWVVGFVGALIQDGDLITNIKGFSRKLLKIMLPAIAFIITIVLIYQDKF